MMTEVRGASNAKAKRELGWQPRYPSWRLGFREGLTAGDRAARGRRVTDRPPSARGAPPGRVRGRLPDARLGRARPRTSSRSRCCACIRRWSAARRSTRRAPTSRPSRRGWRSTSCARPARGGRATSASGCRSRSPPPTATIRRPRPSRPTRSRWRSSSCSRCLTPEQRAAFLLHDVFDYGYDEVAEIIGTSAGRTLASSPSRARRQVEGQAALRALGRGAPRSSPTASSPRWSGASSTRLEALLAEDVELHGDGGGKAPAIKHAVFGRAKVARMLAQLDAAGLRDDRRRPVAPGAGERASRAPSTWIPKGS